ncbi:hypothetical protein [Novosphingobium sp. AAP1]|uniref:hypothetical protein n=1 Tax=Novosphingobium sp. AAP1 TaxID=1523413 RepID=UPI0006B8F6B5|nr:hypothetical protein [Novosphingobium sp. AAP1]
MTQIHVGDTIAPWLCARAPLLARVLAWIARTTLALDRAVNAALATTVAWTGAICAVIALQILLIITHKPWLDEWQAVLIAVQTPTWPDLLAALRYEGHPPLWYAILRGLTHFLSAPLLTLPVAAALIAVPGQLAILLGAPFARSQRLCLALSEFVLFEFLTVSRSLTLGAVCVFLALALWRRGHWAWPFIILLPQCDFLFGVLSFVFAGWRWVERRAPLGWLGGWIASGLLAAWWVRPAPDVAPAITQPGRLARLIDWLAGMSAQGLPLQWHGLRPEWGQPPPALLGAIALLAVAAMAWTQLRGRPADRLVLAGFAGFTLVFSVAVYALSVRHLMLSTLLLVAMVWRQALAGGPGPGVWMRVWLWLVAGCGVFMAVVALIMPFNNSDRASAWIASHNLSQERWLAFPESAGEGISGLSGMPFQRLGKRCTQSFTRWNNPEPQKLVDGAQFYRVLAATAKHEGSFYLLSDFSLPDMPPLIRRIGDVPAGLDGQAFHFYRVGEGLPPRGQATPPCTAPLRPFVRF